MPDQQFSNRSHWEKFTHKLLATTCLGVAASGAAHATTIVEGTGPAPADFSNLSPGYLLPFDTTIVQGVLHSGVDTSDWFEFEDLLAGSPFALYGRYNPFGQERGVSFQVFNSSNL